MQQERFAKQKVDVCFEIMNSIFTIFHLKFSNAESYPATVEPWSHWVKKTLFRDRIM